MKILKTPAAMRRWSALERRKGKTIGFVPTMGCLHAGHAALLERARRENDRVVLSIFVNPLQFGPNEDFARYPRTFSADLALARKAGVDAVYHPSIEAVYPDGFQTSVEVGGLSRIHDGRFRPGHFRGVATVVLKLFQASAPDRAYFGEKDYQQLVIIRRMTRDLDLPVKIVACPTVREKDGLALSSRNVYLSAQERSAAPRLYEALRWGAAELRRPGADLGSALRGMRAAVEEIPGVTIDYISVVEPEDLKDASGLDGPKRILAAIRVGKTRLIDNVRA